MYDHKCIVLFTLPFHFQLKTKSQNGAFHFKLFSDYIFDLVMTQNDIKLVTICLTVHNECTFIFHVLHISTLHCPDLVRWLKSPAVMFSWSTGVLSDCEACGSQATSVMKSIAGEVICSLCSVIADKQKGFWFESLHHPLGMPFEKPSQAHTAAGNS